MNRKDKQMLKWYAVKGLYRWFYKNNGKTALFEERVVIFKAESFDDALDQAEKEAITYCAEDPKANFIIESLNKYCAHDILDEKLESGVEIFSDRRESNLNSTQYLKKYYPEMIKKNG